MTSRESAPAGGRGLTDRIGDFVRRSLPRGDALPEETWQQRHRAILILLWLHSLALPIVGVVNGQPVFHAVAESSLVATAAVIASISSFSRGMRMVSATIGLVTSSALLVHFSGGLIEFHFHFFVIVAVVTLYQSWLPFLVALAYVVTHHGVMGALDPHGVYNHPAAIANPWKWAFVHGLFILGESCALLVAWRMNEMANRHAEESYEQRLKEEHARYEAQEKYREIFENSVEGMYEASLTEGLVTANPSLARMLGYDTVEDLLADDDHGELLLVNPEEGQELLRLIEEHDFVVGFEHEVKSRDGDIRCLSNSARAIRDASGRLVGVQGSVEDITDRKQAERQRAKLEDQLRQAQKMEAVGQLAGGIAHDFNNILSVVINYASFVKDEMTSSDPGFEDVSEIVNAGERGAKLVKQILAFSRREVVDPEIINLNGTVETMQEMLKRTLGEDIELELKLGPNLWPVNIDPTQVEQVLLNLAVNARDAMKQGGSLVIETSNEEFDDLVAEQHPELTTGNYVSLSVSDTGTGMEEEVRSRIFEPFYTTKAVGEGTGLGLAMVYGVVKRANGHVYVYSEPQLGTRFRIYLPVADGSSIAASGSDESLEVPHGGDRIVLLVEDEPAVRSMTARILERGGYVVMAAASGREALTAWRDCEGRIDLLLTDVIMPGMSGKELSEFLRSEDPDLRVLYMSGYTDAIVASRGMLSQGEALVQKPFAATTLLRKVAETLDRSMSPAG